MHAVLVPSYLFIYFGCRVGVWGRDGCIEWVDILSEYIFVFLLAAFFSQGSILT